MSGDRRSRSRSLRRRSYSRSRSRNRSRSADKARQPCVFYFSKEAKGCKFSGRECKFSHDKYDYENWNKDGRDLPNTGLIFRETPVYPSDRRRSRSRSRRRSYSRSRSRSRSRSPRKKRIRERSFTLSPIRDGGYQPQGFSRTTRGFVNIPPDHVEKYVIDARDLKKRRKSESVRNGRSRSRDSRPSKSSKHVSPAQKRIVKQERRSRSSSKPSRSKSPKKSVKQQKSKKDAKKKSKRKRKSSTSSSSNSSSDSEVESKQPRKVTSRIEHSNGIEFIDNDMTFKEALKNQGKRDKNIAREVKQDMSITKARQMILHLYEKSGEKPIFEHVDCSKLPQNPESAPQSTSVAGGNLLAAMFGTADDEEEELQGDSSEPEKLREKKAELAKTEKPRGTTGIAINDRITWWQKMVAKKSDVKTPKKAKKAKKKKRKVSESESSESDEKYSPVKNEKKDSRKSSKSRKSSRKQSPSIKKERRSRSRSMSISRSPSPVRRRSPAKRRRSPARRRSLSRSISRSRSPSRRRESRSGSESMDEARKPCVFYFSKNAQGCRFSGRECKFSHDKYDYDYWNRSGRDLPNTGLIERTKPLRDNRRSYTPDRRRY